ncbi:hypothetical protein C8Q80DRAFT_1266068 [Daedaleopsis nitida]|nr:hypothetical protein C8Q80DRAFT_1266068 [Daedaleopsis nitida]
MRFIASIVTLACVVVLFALGTTGTPTIRDDRKRAGGINLWGWLAIPHAHGEGKAEN